ncbi:L-threonine 3-dehydrogenase [Streptomyces antimycoticus]
MAPCGQLRRLPEHVDVADAALIEPLSCAVRGYDVLNGNLGAEVLIYGSGTMGLMMLECAKRTGAASVDMLNVDSERLATAGTLGCTPCARLGGRAGAARAAGMWSSTPPANSAAD